MNWFSRIKEGITTTTKDKKETPEGLWYKCPKCKELIPTKDHEKKLCVCDCGYHQRINSKEYFKLFFDNGKNGGFTYLEQRLAPTDPLKFVDKQKYGERLKGSQKKTGLKDAICIAHGRICKQDIVIGCMNFDFIGGSMGSVVGEKISRSIDY